MGLFSKIAISLVVLYIASFVFIKVFNPPAPNRKLYSSTSSTPFEPKFQPKDEHRFVNPSLAYKVLTQLDVFTPVDERHYLVPGGTAKQVNGTFLGLKSDDHYCEKHRAYFCEASAYFFNKMNIIFEVGRNADSVPRVKAIAGTGYDIMPNVGGHMPATIKNSSTIDIKPDVNMYFTAVSTYIKKELGKHFSCLTQSSNHIPGNRILSRKDFVAQASIEYGSRYADKPQCFTYDKFFPRTWLLTNKTDCEAFFAQINSAQYQKDKAERTIVYMRKTGVGAHRGQGVQPVNDEEEAELRKMYANGKKCGAVKKNYIIQHYIYNPLLLESHKFDFRMYMLVASTNPFMAYYHDGFLRVSLVDYDVSSNDKKSLLTNLVLSEGIYEDVRKGALYQGMDEEDLRVAQQWSFERLHNYLMKSGVVTDPNWLDNYLRPEFKKAMIHLVRLAKDNMLRDSTVYELYGVDFMLDTNLNLWFIEANAGPAFDGYSKPMEKFITKMLADHFEIIHGLLKSRMQRIIKYVNGVITDGSVVQDTESKNVIIKDLEQKRNEFKKVIANGFEPEFEPKATNGFSKFMDEHFEGTDMYLGLVPKECL
jgi:hypothetical protein